MTRVARPEILERNQQIVEAYKAGKEMDELAQRFFLSVAQVRNVLVKAEVPLRRRGKGYHSRAGRKVVSKLNALVAVRILNYCKDAELEGTSTKAVKFGFSERRMQQILAGQRDITLCELERIAEVMNTKMENLIAAAE